MTQYVAKQSNSHEPQVTQEPPMENHAVLCTTFKGQLWIWQHTSASDHLNAFPPNCPCHHPLHKVCVRRHLVCTISLTFWRKLVYWALCHLYSYHLQIKTSEGMAQNLLLAIPEQLRLGNVLLLQKKKKNSVRLFPVVTCKRKGWKNKSTRNPNHCKGTKILDQKFSSKAKKEKKI